MEDFSDSKRLAQVYGALFNKRHGIITSLIEEPEGPDTRGLFVFTGLTIEASYFRDNRQAMQQEARNGSGASFDRAGALWATFGEALERYSAFIYFPEQLILASANELGDAIFPLDQHILFSPAQYAQPGFPFYPIDLDLPRYWVAAKDLSDGGTEKWLPANMVFLGMKLSSARESIVQNASTGLSCADSFLNAVRGGLCEVIERDAFSAMWQLAYSPKKLVLTDETFASLQPGVRKALQNPNVKIHLWSISTDTGIPVIMALADNVNEGLMAFGSCANPNLERAINKAVIESLHGLSWSHRIRNRGKPMPTLEEIKGPSDHFSYYLDPSRRHLLDFVFANQETISSSELKQQQDPGVQDMINHLKQLGFQTLAVDVTTADVADLGLCVARVIVPGLHPLLFGHDMVSLDERRLRTIAKVWGMSGFPAPNPAPHPFP